MEVTSTWKCEIDKGNLVLEVVEDLKRTFETEHRMVLRRYGIRSAPHFAVINKTESRQ